MTTTKGTIDLVHLYPREMSIYGDLGNTRCLAQRIRRHGYEVRVHNHDPGATLPETAHLFMGGGGQDSGQSRVEDDLAVIGDRHVVVVETKGHVVCPYAGRQRDAALPQRLERHVVEP